MGQRPGQQWEERILGFEELSEEEQRLTEAWLSEHPAALEHLARLRAKEAAGLDPVKFQDGVLFEGTELNGAESEAEQACLADLRRRLGHEDSGRGNQSGGATGSIVKFPAGSVKWSTWLGALAAVLIVALTLPLSGDNDDLISGLSVRGMDLTAGPVRSPGAVSLPAGVLATGQAFELDFHLDRDARVVIIHLDPEGTIGRVVPNPAESDFTVLSGGRNYRFPGPESGEDWILGPGAGMESFLIAAHPGNNPDLDRLDTELADLQVQGFSRAEILAAMVEILTEWGAEVEKVEFRHID